MARPAFRGGHNLAMKVPPHQWERTVAFYEDVLGLPVLQRNTDDDIASVCFEYGSNKLWVDRVPSISQAEVWLDVVTDDPEAAADYLESAQVVRCDEIEPLPPGFRGFWIANPAAIITNVKTAQAE